MKQSTQDEWPLLGRDAIQHVVKNWYKFVCLVMDYIILLLHCREEYAVLVNCLWSSGIFCRNNWRKQFNYVSEVCCEKILGEGRVVLLVTEACVGASITFLFSFIISFASLCGKCRDLNRRRWNYFSIWYDLFQGLSYFKNFLMTLCYDTAREGQRHVFGLTTRSVAEII
jgi:hypothetical protein